MTALDVYPAVRNRLAADVALAALVDTRIYVTERPANETGAAVVLTLIGVTTNYEMGDDREGVTDCRVEVNSLSSATLDNARQVAQAVDSAMTAMLGDHSNGLRVQSVRRESLVDLSDLTGQQKAYRITADYIVSIVED